MKHLGVCGLLVAGAMSCAPYSDYCTEAMDCEDGNDADIDTCEEEWSGYEDWSSAYDCSEEFDEYFACKEEKARCVTLTSSTRYTDCDSLGQNCKCSDEQEGYSDCIDHASEIYYEELH